MVRPLGSRFQQPRTRFVAEFVGKTNLIDAVAEGPDAVTRGKVRLRVASADLRPGAPAAVSIRPHQIEVAPGPGGARPPGASTNELRGTILRASYLGDGVDYQVRVAGSDLVLRVVAPPSLRLPPGATVGLRVAPEACIPLADSSIDPPAGGR